MKSILNNYIKKIDTRKFFGTIIGGIFFICCILFFTYAYYEWKSENTSIALQINDLSTKCIPGTDVTATNIGPVLNYEDGVISEFSVENGMDKEMAIDLRLDITSISDNLLVESFKYAVVTDTTGGTNYDYANPVIEGTFETFKVGSNVITTALVITPSITQSFQFIVYIDGNMKNDINMQSNNLVANLMIGNCEENATSMDELEYQAIYSATDNSLTFIYNKRLEDGDVYNNKAVTKVYTGFEDTWYTSASRVPWYTDGNYANITTVTFEEVVSPVGTAYWFYGFSNLTSINLEKLDTSKVTSMSYMFYNCSGLTTLDVSNFDTSNVTAMNSMFSGCSSLVTLNVSNFDTSKVVAMEWMFNDCISLTSLDLSKFNTSNATSMAGMFYECNSLISLDVSKFNTNKVTNMSYMFLRCKSLKELNVSNFDTSNVTNMHSMFDTCNTLESLDVSNFDTNKVTNMAYMFYSCSSLTELDVSGWDTSNVTNMAGMFWGVAKITILDVQNFNTSKVEKMNGMFASCSNLISLDLNKWDTTNVTNMGGYYNADGLYYVGMFEKCTKLTTTITIRNPNTTYENTFKNAATAEGAKITINYTNETSDLVDAMITNTENNIVNGNVAKGVEVPILTT